jgi:hypothetical protein
MVDKVANLERGGRLERVKPSFSWGKLWRALAGNGGKAQERTGS